ncbi:MAG: hypothetical protein PHO92_05860, partial [Candidatus Peribacteraceae bacterium]|nr:hypothetical protein [Candidatus Peribacteraceae bacterium]
MPLSYRVERTCNRHSRAVYKDDEIVIRLAQGLTHTEEHNHIVGLVQRMQRMVERDRKRRRIDPFRPLLEETSVLEIETMSGNVHTFALVAGGRTKAIWNGQDCALHIGPKTNQQRLH